MNDGSGFVLRRLVVRRAEDSFLRETYGTKLGSEGRRKGRLEICRRGREMDMSWLLIGLLVEQECRKAIIDLFWPILRPICRVNVGRNGS